MANEVTVKEREMSQAMSVSLNNASSIITKDYLAKLEDYELVPPSEEDSDTQIADCGKFFKLTKLVVNREENFLNKLTTIINVVFSIGASLVTIINSDGVKIAYYFGIISKKHRDSHETGVNRRKADTEAFSGAVGGNLLGSEVIELSDAEVSFIQKEILSKEGNCFASVSGIAALREADEKNIDNYVQGIENLVDSLKGKKYTVVMLADPVEASQIGVVKQGYEVLHTQLASFAGSSVTFNESDTLSLSKTRTEGFTEGITTGITMTQSKTKSKGHYIGTGLNVSVGVPMVLGAGISINSGINRGTAEAKGEARNRAEIKQKNEAVAEARGTSRMAGRSLQVNYENRSIRALLNKIDKHLERLDECESFGAFDCAAYVIAETKETALTVASNYNALMRGMESNVQASHINVWHMAEKTGIIAKYMGSLVHPRFWQNKENHISVTPATIISGSELALQIGLPKKSIAGVTVIPMAPFGRNVAEPSDELVELGTLHHMGHDDGPEGKEQRVRIDVQSLAMHTFITGSTGAGKTTAVSSILDKLISLQVKGRNERIKFLVIEPAKGEYKDRFGNYPDVYVYGTNYKKTPLLRINPFSFPEDVHVLEHIDRLVEIFNVCWPMYAAMPAILKDAIQRAYIVSGWNMETSECRYQDFHGRNLYPSFVDVLRQVNEVIEESAYSSDSKGDYKGALCTRIKSLTNGLYGQIFTNDELRSEDIFDRNVIVDLSRVGSSETKSLVMGLLVMKLQEHRMANAMGGNAPLRHITVLEEAHNILKRTSMEQTGEGANLIGKSVEMLANSIAEMRTYGEGFIIADQAPGLMDLSVIRNTNTKIILRLPDYEDRKLVGMAASLNDDQILELSRLKTFVAAIYQNNWLEPVLCSIDTNFKDVPLYQYECKAQTAIHKKDVIEYLLVPLGKRNELDAKYIERMTDIVFRLSIPAETKSLFLQYTEVSDKERANELRSRIAYDIFNSDTAFWLAKPMEKDFERWVRQFMKVLEPDITSFSEAAQRKVLAVLMKERAELTKSSASLELFEHMREFM